MSTTNSIFRILSATLMVVVPAKGTITTVRYDINGDKIIEIEPEESPTLQIGTNIGKLLNLGDKVIKRIERTEDANYRLFVAPI